MKRKVSPKDQAYKSRGMKAGKNGPVGKPESHPLPEPQELKKKK